MLNHFVDSGQMQYKLTLVVTTRVVKIVFRIAGNVHKLACLRRFAFLKEKYMYKI